MASPAPAVVPASDEQLRACCEGPREWYVEGDAALRLAFSEQQIQAVETGALPFLRYPSPAAEGDTGGGGGGGGGVQHKYAEGALSVGDRCPNPLVWTATRQRVRLLGGRRAGRLLVLDFGSFS